MPLPPHCKAGPPGHAARPRQILCAEDNPTIGDLLIQFLSREGHIVHWVDNGLDAWQHLSAQLDRFHLLITDHQMPELNGIALVERLRREEYRGGIIVYSSPLRTADRLRYQELQVDRVVEKSASPAELLLAVRSILSA